MQDQNHVARNRCCLMLRNMLIVKVICVVKHSKWNRREELECSTGNDILFHRTWVSGVF